MDFVVVKDIQHGVERAKEILYEEVDKKTILFLSGGKTPKVLYETLAKEQILTPAGVGMVDERFGSPMHENSNELMVREAGLIDYLNKIHVPFYSMLLPVIPSGVEGSQAINNEEMLKPSFVHDYGLAQQVQHDAKKDSSVSPQNDNINIRMTEEQLARNYDNLSRDLFFKFPRSVGILGMGPDGHIASIMPNRKDFVDPLFEKEQKYLYASSIDDPKKYGKRITLTFAGLSLMDKLIVFVFGKEKQKALKNAFTPGFITDCPARFFQETEIARKTILITDQKI